MKVAVIATAPQQKELEYKATKPNAHLVFSKSIITLPEPDIYDCFFYLDENIHDIDKKIFNNKNVFINDVVHTLKEKEMPANFHRLNGWNGFLQRDVWEIATNDESAAAAVSEATGWKFCFVKDEPGLVAARVVSMIINEAFYALEEKVSTREDINLAMKLGTNYPYGPFEWMEKIGVKNIYHLLNKLTLSDKRYVVAPLLKNAMM